MPVFSWKFVIPRAQLLSSPTCTSARLPRCSRPHQAIASRIRFGSTASALAQRLKSPQWKPSPSRNAIHDRNNDTLISFPEEPLGLPADQGFGFLEANIGDEIGDEGEYRIVRKLAYGSNSSIWLTYPSGPRLKPGVPPMSAIKILSQYATQQLGSYSDELRILQRLSEPSSSHKGRDFCSVLYDAFVVEENGGLHQCMLFNVMAGDVQELQSMYKGGVMPLSSVKTVMGQMLVVLQYLHEECRIVHTDLRPENLFIRNPFPGHDLKRIFINETAQYYPAMAVLGREVRPIVSLPLLTQERLPEFVSREDFWQFRLGDFGEAQFIDDKIKDCIMPDNLRAPEIILGHPWDEKVDIWSLGCLTFEFLTGRSLFNDDGISFGYPDRDVLKLALMVRCRGPFPKDMLDNCSQVKVAQYFGPDLPLEHVDIEDHARPPIIDCLKQCNRELAYYPQELEAAAAFIDRCLALRPSDRPSAGDLLRDPWLMSEPVWSFDRYPAGASKEETVGEMVTLLSPWRAPYLGVVAYITLLLGTAWFVWNLMY